MPCIQRLIVSAGATCSAALVMLMTGATARADDMLLEQRLCGASAVTLVRVHLRDKGPEPVTVRRPLMNLTSESIEPPPVPTSSTPQDYEAFPMGRQRLLQLLAGQPSPELKQFATRALARQHYDMVVTLRLRDGVWQYYTNYGQFLDLPGYQRWLRTVRPLLQARVKAARRGEEPSFCKLRQAQYSVEQAITFESWEHAVCTAEVVAEVDIKVRAKQRGVSSAMLGTVFFGADAAAQLVKTNEAAQTAALVEAVVPEPDWLPQALAFAHTFPELVPAATKALWQRARDDRQYKAVRFLYRENGVWRAVFVPDLWTVHWAGHPQHEAWLRAITGLIGQRAGSARTPALCTRAESKLARFHQ
jgi:hypothetical protein